VNQPVVKKVLWHIYEENVKLTTRLHIHLLMTDTAEVGVVCFVAMM